MKINLNIQMENKLTLPVMPVGIYTGSALPLEIVGIPALMAGGVVSGVNVTVTNVASAAAPLFDYWCTNALNRTTRRLLKDCSDNIVYSTREGKLLALRGMEDFIVIDTDDVLMICPRDEEKLKDFLSQLAMPEYEEYR